MQDRHFLPIKSNEEFYFYARMSVPNVGMSACCIPVKPTSCHWSVNECKKGMLSD